MLVFILKTNVRYLIVSSLNFGDQILHHVIVIHHSWRRLINRSKHLAKSSWSAPKQKLKNIDIYLRQATTISKISVKRLFKGIFVICIFVSRYLHYLDIFQKSSQIHLPQKYSFFENRIDF